MSGGNTTVQDLRKSASKASDRAQALMAIALALEDGKLSKQEARKAVQLHESDNPLALIQSDVYPGDEYFDKAVDTQELRWFA